MLVDHVRTLGGFGALGCADTHLDALNIRCASVRSMPRIGATIAREEAVAIARNTWYEDRSGVPMPADLSRNPIHKTSVAPTARLFIGALVRVGTISIRVGAFGPEGI